MKTITNKFTEDEYGISNGVLKQISNKYIDTILSFYNAMLNLNYIPIKWKTAKISMIPKQSNDTTNPKNYRPISVTPSLMRLYEKIISSRINKWLTEKNINSTSKRRPSPRWPKMLFPPQGTPKKSTVSAAPGSKRGSLR
jgi:hypothetical protein